MNIGITGVTGFIGSRLALDAKARGYRVVGFSRNPRPHPDIDEMRPFTLDGPPDLTGIDAIVHLAGETIMGIWTPAKKRRIRNSRIVGTRRIVEAIETANAAPRVFVCGSAVGIYGNTGEREVDESSPAGDGFLADVAREWEAAAGDSTKARTVHLRTGFVIGSGGAMRLIAPVFRAGLGGRLGSGRQWMSCIHVSDVAGMALHAIEQERVSGPINAVLPEAVRNSEFTKIVANAVHRPAIVPAPALALKVLLGEMSTLLLDSQRVHPTHAIEMGYAFRHPTVNAAVTDAVGSSSQRFH